MNRLDGIRATGIQIFSTTISNGDSITITLAFNAAVQEWKMNVEWDTFVLNGNRVFSSLNMLAQYEKIIPFGLAVITEGGGEPFLVNDFSSERVNMYTLSPDEIEEINDFYMELRDAG